MKLKRLSLFLALVMIISAFAGTFTITFAETPAVGGTFEIWDGDTKVKDYAGKITDADAGVVAGNTIKLTSDYKVQDVAAAPETLSIAITIDGQGKYQVTNSNGTTDRRLFNTSADITFVNVTLYTKRVAGALQMNLENTTLTLNNVTITASCASTSGAIVANKANQKVYINGGSMSLMGCAVYVSAAGSEVEIKDNKILSAPTSAIHAFVRTNSEHVSVKFNNSIVVNTGSIITRVVSSYGVGTTVEIKNSYMFVYCSDSVVEFNKGSQEAPGKVDISNSVIVGATSDIVDTDAASAYAEINIKDSYLRAAGFGLDLNGANAKVDISGSSIVTTKSAIEATASSVVSATNSALCSSTAGTAAVVGVTPSYTACVTGSGMDLTQFGTNLEGEALYVFAGASFRVGNNYYSSIKTAAAANEEVFVIADYYTHGRENHGIMTTLTGVANASGEYPTIYTSQRLVGNSSGNVAEMELTFQNFNLVNTWADCAAQINDKGVLTLNNMTVAANNNNGCLVLQKGSKVVINNSTIDAMNSHGVRFNETAADLEPVAEVNNSVLKASKGGKAISLIVNGIMNISEDSKVIVDDADGFGIDSKTLTVNGTEITSNVAAAAMLTGASVRIAKGATAENLVESGIRFESKLTAAQIAAAEASGATITYGTVVFKYNDLGNKTVAELVEAANADANDNLKVAEIKAVNGKVIDEETGDMTIRAAIINIKEANYNVAFGAVAYIELTYENGSTVRIYGAFDSTNNVRSIKQVAESALADYKTAEEIEANEGYTFGNWNYTNEITVEIEGVETTVYSCYTDEQIAILNTYAGK